MTEQELIYALQQGEEPAFKQVVDTYKDRLYNTILGFIPDTAEAEDVLQEVFIKVFENITLFRGGSMLSTWMYRITVTQSLDAIRSKTRKKRAGKLLSLFGVGEGADYETVDVMHPGVLAEKKESWAYLFKAMQQLPDNQRAAFVLQKTEGMSQQEIARVLHISVGAVESLLSRAKQNLKKSLSKFYYEK